MTDDQEQLGRKGQTDDDLGQQGKKGQTDDQAFRDSGEERDRQMIGTVGKRGTDDRDNREERVRQMTGTTGKRGSDR